MCIATYIDRVSEELVSAYEAERENWLRNLGAARGARVRTLLSGDRIDLESSEAILGYRLRQHHVGVVCWAARRRPAAAPSPGWSRRPSSWPAVRAARGGRIFLPQDETSAWAWLPLGAGDTFPLPAASACAAAAAAGIRFALGAPGSGVAGFRRTHQQALGAHAVALAAGRRGRP